MKKFVVSLALLGLVSVGSMAFISNGGDNPPESRRTAVDGRSNDDVYRQRGHRHHRRGGCCGDNDRRDDRRRYGCCEVEYDCGACRDKRCTVDGCHRGDKLCDQCAEWCDGHRHRGHRHCR